MTLKERIAAAMTYAAQYPDPEVALGEPVDDPAAVLRDCATALDAAQGEVSALRQQLKAAEMRAHMAQLDDSKRDELAALRARVAELEDHAALSSPAPAWLAERDRALAMKVARRVAAGAGRGAVLDVLLEPIVDSCLQEKP